MDRTGAGGPGRRGAPSRAAKLLPVVTAVGAVVALALHFTASAAWVYQLNTRVVSYEAAASYVKPVFRQNWRLFAPRLSTDERVLHVRAWVPDPEAGGVATAWVPFGLAPERSSAWDTVDLNRRNQMVESALHELEDAEFAMREDAGDSGADPAALAADPETPDYLVKRYEEATGLLTRLAVAQLDPAEERSIVAVQVQETILEFPGFKDRRSAAEPIYERELPWWDVGR